jgi:hypothetical protein
MDSQSFGGCTISGSRNMYRSIRRMKLVMHVKGELGIGNKIKNWLL